MIRALTRKMLGSAAAAVDVMATAAVTAHANRIGQKRERPHADRLRVLERLAARYQGASLDGFFPEPQPLAPGARLVRTLGNDGSVSDLSWHSAFAPLDPEVTERY